MVLLISFIILTFIYMLALEFMYKNRNVFVLCDVIETQNEEENHIITGVFTDQKSAQNHIYNNRMYIIQIPLNKFKKVTPEELVENLKQEKETQEMLETLAYIMDNKEACETVIKEKEKENERRDLSDRSD